MFILYYLKRCRAQRANIYILYHLKRRPGGSRGRANICISYYPKRPLGERARISKIRRKINIKITTALRKIYQILFPEDVDPEAGKISGGSPIGRALMGKQEGDEVVILLPEEKLEYEVTRIITIHENSEDPKE